ncbi:hypothetical protein MLGJGCBP_06795 [Rhodococcus sp. T7]|nr:hypothetical protein MLGJGCBP_06795 [Rhodococcus sp. T7]
MPRHHRQLTVNSATAREGPPSATKPKLLSASTSPGFLRDFQNPLLRNGMLLTVSSVLSALIGFGYWAVAARKYDAAAVGSNSAAISMMMLAAAVSQLNMSSAMARFVPTAGHRTKRLVAGAYAACGLLALVVAFCSVLLVRVISPGTNFLDDERTQALFVVGTVCGTLFVLQDGVLTGLRRAAVVPLENVAFALTKVGLIVALAAALPSHGIFVSWTTSLAVTVPVVGAFLFMWAIPRRVDAAKGTDTLPPVKQLARFVAVDYVGAVCSVGSVMLLPLLVLHELGPAQTAYFSVAWAIANTVHLINVNLGTSLVVETAADQSQFTRKSRQIIVHGCRLVIPIVLAAIVLAPFVLGIFGTAYQSGSDVLRLLALAAVPNILVSTAISSARAHRRLGLLLSIQVTNFVLTLGLCSVLLKVVGLTGAGWACLLSQTLIAIFLTVRRDLWLSTDASTHGAPTSRFDRLQSATAVFVIRFASAARLRPCLDRVKAVLRGAASRNDRRELRLQATQFDDDPALGKWTGVWPVRTVTDVSVAFLTRGSGTPTAVLKVARSPLASAELRAQREILAILATDSRLDGWRRLLPEVLAFRENSIGSVSIETFRPMVDLATVLSRNPEQFEPLTTIALSSIDELHLRTGELSSVDDHLLELWVDQPLHDLTEMCRALSPESMPTVAQIGTLVRRVLTERIVLVGWAHGDFHAGNVRLATERGGVTGIVDWGGARPERLGLLDDYFMLLTSSRTVERLELGSIVAHRLRAGGLAKHERRQLEIVYSAASDTDRGEKIDERVTILLTWMHHLAELSRKCRVYREHRVWWALNAVPVLRAFSEIAPALEAQLRATELISAVGTIEDCARPTPALDFVAAQKGTAEFASAEHQIAPGWGPTLCLERPLDRPRVSVVICAYTEDRWDNLVLAVESAQSQSEPADEIVVVIDHNAALLSRSERELHGVTVVQNAGPQGLSGARNSGVSVVTGDIVAFLDDDAFAAFDWLAELTAPYADPDVLGVGGLVIGNWINARPAWFPPEFDWVVGCTYRGMPTERAAVRNMIGANMSLRRDLIVEAGGFETALGRVGTRPVGCEETELCIRVQRAHPRGAHIYEPAARVWHSVPDTRGSWSYFRSRCYAEGLSKATVSVLAGPDRALASERSYLTSIVPFGIVRHLAAGLRGRLWSFVAALVLLSGVATTVVGYVAGTRGIRDASAKWRSVRTRVAAAMHFAGLLTAAALWLASLPRIELSRMGDYGLLPLLPLTFWSALVVLLVSFSVSVRRRATATWLLVAHVVTLIAILHATPCLTYGTLRYSWAWKHIGIVDYFQRHQGVDTSLNELSAYQFWPGFFNLNAMLVKAAGLQSALDYAVWAPPFFNLLLIGPLFLIFGTFTTDRRLIWTGITIYFLGAWVGQDYFAPQACVYFLYLTIVALVLRYLRRDVRARDRRIVAAVAVVPMMAAIVPTHQLTPLMVICGLGVLALFRTRRVALLTVLMVALTLGWDLLFAGPFITQNLAGLMSAFGNLGGNTGSGFVDLGAASHSQAVVAKIDRLLSAAIWALAVVGCAKRFRGRGELALPLLAVAPIPLILSNDYGGEMIFRVYLLGLPFAAFYAAAAFFPRDASGRIDTPVQRSWLLRPARLALPAVLVLLMSGFTVGYYGKEQTAYFPQAEYDAALFVYGIAPRGSLIVSATSGYPWAFMNLEFYDHMWFSTFELTDRQAIVADPTGMFSDMMSGQNYHHAYLILTHSQWADMELSGDLPRDALPRIEQTLAHSPRFTVIYQNSRAVVITLTQPTPEAK